MNTYLLEIQHYLSVIISDCLNMFHIPIGLQHFILNQSSMSCRIMIYDCYKMVIYIIYYYMFVIL